MENNILGKVIISYNRGDIVDLTFKSDIIVTSLNSKEINEANHKTLDEIVSYFKKIVNILADIVNNKQSDIQENIEYIENDGMVTECIITFTP